MTEKPFITLDHITVRLRDRRLLAGTCWQIGRGENWVIWGPNGAGKSTLAHVLTGQAAVVQGAVRRHYRNHPAWCAGRTPIALVSPEQYHRLYQHERLLSEMQHFAGRSPESTPAGDLLHTAGPAERSPAAQKRRERILDLLQMAAIGEQPLAALSSGEMRKLLLCQALLADPCLLILDEP
ncbi:MAG: ATP-binding cassette domain-containing protein, partial [Desulfobacteraceae bacterium]